MIKLGMVRVGCYCLTIVVLIAAWIYMDFAVNEAFDQAESIARAISRGIAQLVSADENFAEIIALEKMHMDRTILFSSIFLLTLIVVLVLLREEVLEHASRIFLAMLVAHLVLAFAWIAFTGTTSAWYAQHYDVIRRIMRSWGWHKGETLALRMGQVHSIVILGEAMLLVWFASLLFGGRTQHRHVHR